VQTARITGHTKTPPSSSDTSGGWRRGEGNLGPDGEGAVPGRDVRNMVATQVEERLAVIQGQLELLRAELAQEGEEPFTLAEVEALLEDLAQELEGQRRELEGRRRRG